MAQAQAPSPSAQAQRAGLDRDQVEQAAWLAVVAMLRDSGRSSSDLPDVLQGSEAASRAVTRLAGLLAWRALTAGERGPSGQGNQGGERGPATVTRIDVPAQREAWARDASAETHDRLEQLVAARTARPLEERPGGDGSWARSVARTEATRLSSQAQVDLARDVLDLPDASKVWISRGDASVRELHRKLHGEPVRGLDSPFWSWPGGEQLRYPGDPEGPPGEVINCRCVMFFLPSSADLAQAAQALKPADLGDSFALAASCSQGGHRPVSGVGADALLSDYATLVAR
jgi:hypothetical protein